MFQYADTIGRDSPYGVRDCATTAARSIRRLRHRRKPVPVCVVGQPFFLVDAPYTDALVLLEDIKRSRIYIGGNHSTPRETERRLGEIGDVRGRFKKIYSWIDAANLAIAQMVKPLVMVHKAAGMDRLDISADGTELLIGVYANEFSLDRSWAPAHQIDWP